MHASLTLEKCDEESGRGFSFATPERECFPRCCWSASPPSTPWPALFTSSARSAPPRQWRSWSLRPHQPATPPGGAQAIRGRCFVHVRLPLTARSSASCEEAVWSAALERLGLTNCPASDTTSPYCGESTVEKLVGGATLGGARPGPETFFEVHSRAMTNS